MIELSEPLAVCAQCATEVHPGARFCHWCGAPVAGRAQAPASITTVEQRRLVTALFVDLTGSTNLGEQLDAEPLREVMQQYYSAMREEIENEGGTVSVFVGDAVMAVFGVPVAHEDDAARAMRCGLRLHVRVDELNRSLEYLDDVRLGVRVGIHTGEILAGQHLTHADPRLGQLTGDALNVAARLEAAAQPGQVVVSERTARAGRGFTLREIGPLELKGKRNPVLAFEVVEVAAPEPSLAATGGRPLLGRATELALLRDTYEQVKRQAHPRVLTVIGDAGLGKSRLLQEFVRGVTVGDGAVRYHGRCLPQGQAIAYWPLAEVLREFADVLIDDASAIAREKILAACGELLGAQADVDTGRVAAALCFTIGLEDGDTFSHMDARQVRQEMYDAWRALFTAMGRRRPTVVEIEDLHEASTALLDLIEDLVQSGTGAVTWLCSARPELHQRKSGWCDDRQWHTCLDLQPLSAADSAAVVDAILGRADLPETLMARMTERAEGNPFFLEEIIRHLIDEGHLVREDNVWTLAVETAQATIPDTVQMALTSRMDLLGADEKTTLQVASVVGRDFWPGPIAHLLERDVADVDRVLERLAEKGFVRPHQGSTIHGDREYTFKHMLTRDVAYQGLPRKQRTAAHVGVADWVAERFVEHRTEMSEILSYHYSVAYSVVSQDRREDSARVEELRQKTFEATVLAAEHTSSRWVVESAGRLAQEAVALAQQPYEEARSLEALGRASWMGLDGNGAWTAWTKAADIRVEHLPDEPVAVARLCGLALESVTRWIGSVEDPIDPAVASSYLDRGMEYVDGAAEERIRLLTAAAWWPFAFPGEGTSAAVRKRALLAGEEAVALAEKESRPDLASAALDGVTHIDVVRGHWGPALAVVERRLQLVPLLSDREEIADILNMAATATYNVGRYSDAWAYAQKAVEATAELNFFQCQALAWRGVANFRRGFWADLKTDVEDTRALLGSAWDDPPQPASTHLIAAALVSDVQGDAAAADEMMARMNWGVIPSLGRPSTMKAPLLAMLFIRRGRFADAHAVLEHPDWATRLEGRGQLLEVRCDLVAAEADWDSVGPLVAEAREFARVAGLESLGAYVERLLGRAATAAGDLPSAIRRLGRARSRFAALGARWETARTELDVAGVLKAVGREADANKVLKLAWLTLEELGSQAELQSAAHLLS